MTDLNRIRRAEGTGPWLHEPRKPRMSRVQYAIAGLCAGVLAFPAVYVSALIIQALGRMMG